MRFSLAETEEEILLLKKNTRLHTDLLNWDTSSEMLSRIFLKINRRYYREQIMNNRQLTRIAKHPRGPEEAQDNQTEMIRGLKEIN